MLSDLTFVRPELLWGIPLVLALAVLLARRHLAAGSWIDVVDERLAPHVLSGNTRQSSTLPWWLLAAVGSLGFIALAGPAWERIEQPVYRSDQAMVVALDLSRSMDAQDVAPSRLLRSRLKILDLLERRASGQTALVVYSANAFTVTPLTDDTDTIAALVNSLGTDIMPSRGSYPVAAIEKGQRLLEQAGVAYGEVLLITDGGTSPAAERYARELKEAGYTLSVLGVGTREGAPIPRANGGFVTDGAGNIAVPRLEEADLKKLAAAGGGRYATLSADNQDLDYLLAGEVSGAAGERGASDESLATDQWREEGPWLVLLILPLAALAFRRGWVLMLLVFVLPVQPAQASIWKDLFMNDNQQAREALANGDPAAAVELFQDPDWKNVAEYRNGDFEAAARGFAEAGDARNLYNLGNAMAKQGKFESALDAYGQVLEIDPTDEDAAYNRDLVQELLEQQQQQQQQQQEQEQGEGTESGDENAEQNEQDGEQSDGQSDGESQDSDAEQQDPSEEDLQALQEELERAAEEQQQEAEQQLTEAELAELRRAQEQEQAMEQWLRRIPNDPGGLLRRKFRYQYQRLGQDQDGNNLWPDDEVQPW